MVTDKPTKTCEQCGQPCPARAQRHCSRLCTDAARKKPRPPCETCGGPTRHWKHHFCSPACKSAATASRFTERFWAKVNKNGPIHPVIGTRCWPWTGSTDQKGYGTFSVPPSKPAKAHRIAWKLTHGEIPDGANVLHRCDNPPCVNADEHLFLGSLIDNNIDKMDKGRARGPSLLTADIVRVIRAEYAAGLSQGALAKRFSVVQPTIQAVVSRRTWKHVE